MIDIIYLAWNRKAYTEFSFSKLVENTDWNMVNKLVVYDDGSTDGTAFWLSERVVELNLAGTVDAEMHHTQALRSPVATMNHYLDHYQSDYFAKIDNDIVVPPEWLGEMYRMMYLHTSVDILGMQADQGPPVLGHYGERKIQKARWIGGVGLIRRRTFKKCRPSPNGRFGWTEFQQGHKELVKAWIKPDLATFELDRLPVEPWRSLARRYVEVGWGREWGPYAEDADDYWSWALPEVES